MQKHSGSSVQNYIIAARTAQGFDDLKHSTQAERLDVILSWRTIQLELGKEKHQVKHSPVPPACRFLKTRHMSFDERKKLAKERKERKPPTQRINSTEAGETTFDMRVPSSPTSSQSSSFHLAHTDFEEAIQQSVAATSKGNPEEDAMIERAIRASVLELQQASKEGNEDATLQRAIQASIAQSSREKGQVPHQSQQLEAALIESIQQRSDLEREPTATQNLDSDDSGIETDEDENIRIAIQSSKQLAIAEHRDQNLEQALAESKKDYEEDERAAKQIKTEEEIVLDYVKRQSLAEDAYKKSSVTRENQQ